MPQRFYTNTVESKYIKSLLSNVNLPVNKSVFDGDLLLSGNTYFYAGQLILCTTSGYLFENTYNIENKQTCSYTQLNIDPPVGGGLISSSVLYDSATHKFLGDYLRFLQSSIGLNLLPYYNCFNYESTSDFTLDDSKDSGYEFVTNPFYKVLLVPIRYNRKYSIYIDSESPVYIKSVIYGDFGMVKYNEIYLTDILNDKIKKYSVSSFTTPIKFSVSNDFLSEPGGLAKAKLLEMHERELYIAIQLPKTNKSSVVVLEGDYGIEFKTKSTDSLLSEGDFVLDSSGISYCTNGGFLGNSSEQTIPIENMLSSYGECYLCGDNIDYVETEDDSYYGINPLFANSTYSYYGVNFSYSTYSAEEYERYYMDNPDESKYMFVVIASGSVPVIKPTVSINGYIVVHMLKEPDRLGGEYFVNIQPLIGDEEYDPYDESIFLHFATDGADGTPSLLPFVYIRNNPAYLQDVSNTLYMHTDSSLSEVNSGVTYAFSNRLLEYLLKNTIDCRETIQQNVNIATNIAGLKKRFYVDDQVQSEIFNKYVKQVGYTTDISGYVDKDVEKRLSTDTPITNSQWAKAGE